MPLRSGLAGMLTVLLVLAGCSGDDDDRDGAESRGEALFVANCASCHGSDAQGVVGPPLVGVADRLTGDEIVDIVTNGRGRMPTFEGDLSRDEIEAVVAYVRGLHDDGTNGASTVPTPTTGARSATDTGGEGWPQFGRDLANTRFNPNETSITAANVGTLTQRWAIGELVGVTSTPTVAEGVAYFGDWTGIVRAVDPETGAEVWTSELGGTVIGSIVIDGDGLLATSGRTLYRLDRETGAVVWQVETHDHPAAMISASPVVADGLVFQGVASGELVFPADDYTFRGSIAAYDAETGAEVWRLSTTPGDETAGAGVGIWSTPAVDVDRGLLFVGTGNTYEEPSAPLADSILAIDYETGDVAWSTQFTNPDVFSAGNPGGKDADVGAAPNLWTADGRELVGAGDKAGVYHALDRETGEVVWETELTPGSYFGGDIGSAAWVDGTLVVPSNIGDPASNAPTNVAHVFGLDAETGDILWESDAFDGLIFAPVSAVPGVAFAGTTVNTMFALDTETGETLWTFTAPNQIGSGPAIVDGNVLWGYGFALLGGPGAGGIYSFTPG